NLDDDLGDRVSGFRPAMPAEQPPGSARPGGQPDEETGKHRRRDAAVILKLVGRRCGYTEERVESSRTQEPPHDDSEDMPTQKRTQHQGAVQNVSTIFRTQILPPGK